MKFVVIDRNNGCRPAYDDDGKIRTVEASDREQAMEIANGRVVQPDELGHPFEVMEDEYIRHCLTAKP
jgi:hypothetical protein